MKPTKVKLLDRRTPCSIDYFIPMGKLAKKKEWLAKHELYEAETNYGIRIVTPVTILDELKERKNKKDKPQKVQKAPVNEENSRVFMMDVITGSLYDKLTGRCLTSSMVYMTKIMPGKNLTNKLLAMKSDDS